MWTLPFLHDAEATMDEATLAAFVQRPSQWVGETIQRHGLRPGTHFRREQGQVVITLRGAVALMLLAGHALGAREVIHAIPRDAAETCLGDWGVCAAFRRAGLDPEAVRAHDEAVRDCLRCARAAVRAAKGLDPGMKEGNALRDAQKLLEEAVLQCKN